MRKELLSLAIFAGLFSTQVQAQTGAGHLYTNASPATVTFSGWGQLNTLYCDVFTLTGDLVETHSPAHYLAPAGVVPGYNRIINLRGDNTGSSNPLCNAIQIQGGDADINADGTIRVNNLLINACGNAGPFTATGTNTSASTVDVDVAVLTAACGSIAAGLSSDPSIFAQFAP